MKIKIDFVSNSSSVSHIIFVPNKFYIDDHILQKLIKQEIEYQGEDPENEDVLYSDAHDFLEDLKMGKNIWRDSGDVDNVTYDVVFHICDENNFILATLDSSSGANQMQGISEEDIKKIMFDHIDIIEMFDFLKKGDKSVIAKTK